MFKLLHDPAITGHLLCWVVGFRNHQKCLNMMFQDSSLAQAFPAGNFCAVWVKKLRYPGNCSDMRYVQILLKLFVLAECCRRDCLNICGFKVKLLS